MTHRFELPTYKKTILVAMTCDFTSEFDFCFYPLTGGYYIGLVAMGGEKTTTVPAALIQRNENSFLISYG